MSTDFSTFIGVDAGPGRRPFTYLAIDAHCQLLSLGSGDAVDILSFAAGQSSALLAVSPPAWMNLEPQTHPAAKKHPANSLGFYLNQHPLDFGLDASAASGVSAPPDLPIYFRPSFSFVSQLQSIGFTPSPAGEDCPRQWLETQAEACYTRFLGLEPFTAGTLEGRIQRQLVLADQELPVPDAMDFFEEITRHRLLHGILPIEKILPQPELNAWVAAFIAWLTCHEPAQVQTLPGAVILPKTKE
jgi:hypothetical protein